MGSEASPVNKKDRSSRYFGVGAFFLLILALFWSVDASLIYIFLGIACYCIFLGFYNKPSNRRPDHQEEQRAYQQAKKDYTSSPPFGEGLKDLFRQQRSTSHGAGPVLQSRKKTIWIFLAIFFTVFMIPIVASLFGSDSNSGDATDYFDVAENQYSEQQYDSAYLNYRRAMKLDPEYTGAILGYGRCLAMRNQPDSALLMYDKALSIDPDSKEAAYSKGLVYYDQKKYSMGVELLKPLLDANPDYYQAMLLMGDFYYVEKKYEDAMIWYEKSYQEGGMRGSTLCHIMAYVYDMRGDTKKAIELYKEALTYDESIAAIHERLGELIPGEEGNGFRAKAVELKQQQ